MVVRIGETTGGEGRRLSDLLELTKILASGPNLKVALTRAAERIASRYGATSCLVFALDEASGELVVEAATGLAWQAARNVRFRMGEGITGRVAQSARPVVVPRVSREPLFLNRSGVYKGPGRGELSYICVPLAAEGRAAGALGVALPYQRERDLEHAARFFGVAGAMMAQAVRAQRLVEAERARLVEENAELRHELQRRYDLHNLIGSSKPMQQVYEQVAQVAGTTTTVLVRGESGTGKELAAHAIHYNSPRAERPFVKVSCAALPESLVESELFGHEKGAFSDARARKPGRFELAHGGTLFLDEIGELSPGTQAKLLRVLQEREFERLGGVEPVKVDVRLIAATNKDLELALQAGAFREDLFYRLNVFTLFLPPLRERKTDLPLLADHFVEKFAAAHGRDVRRIATTAIDMLMAYHWPGNVRELENCIERAVLVCEGGVIHAHHLPPTLQTAEVSGTVPQLSLSAAVAAYEKDLIQDALKSARGNRARAARLLDTTERIVGYKLRKYGIDGARFRK
jgi:Nif-specific regulatory protein